MQQMWKRLSTNEREFWSNKAEIWECYLEKSLSRLYEKNTAKHYAKDPDKVIQRVATRKQQDLKAEGNYSDFDIQQVRNELGDRCRYCRAPLNRGGEIEHLTPISKGGSNWPSNITLSCFQCNKEKHGKTLAQYLQWRRDRGLPVYE